MIRDRKTKLERGFEAHYNLKVFFITKRESAFMDVSAIICIQLAIAINQYLESNRKSDATNKFLTVQGLYPDVARKIDSAYNINADSLLKTAQVKMQERQVTSQVAIKAKQAAEESKTVNEKLRGKTPPIFIFSARTGVGCATRR